MTDSQRDFGTTALTKREVRNTFLGLAAAVVLLLLFGVGLAMRLRSSADDLQVFSESPASAEVAGTETTGTETTGPETASAETAGVETASEATRPPATDSVIEQQSPTQAVLPVAEGDDEPRYGVRVGIFANPENADRMLVRLQAEGYAPFVVFHRSGDQTLRYVYAVTAPTEAEAGGLAATLRDAFGMDTWIEPVEPGR